MGGRYVELVFPPIFCLAKTAWRRRGKLCNTRRWKACPTSPEIQSAEYCGGSFVTQRFNRVQIRCLPRRVDPENQSYTRGCGEGQNNPERGQPGWKRRPDRRQKPDDESSGQHANDSTDRGQDDGFNGELQQHITFARADCFTHSNFTRRSVTDTSMMFITPTPPTIRATLDTANMKTKSIPVNWFQRSDIESCVKMAKLSWSCVATLRRRRMTSRISSSLWPYLREKLLSG